MIDKHIYIQHLQLKYLVGMVLVVLEYIITDLNPSDVSTKAMVFILCISHTISII